MAHKKAGGSSRNGRDSAGRRLGVKKFGGESVLISPDSIQSIDSPNKRIHVTLSRDEIKGSPSVDTAQIELIETLPPPII